MLQNTHESTPVFVCISEMIAIDSSERKNGQSSIVYYTVLSRNVHIKLNYRSLIYSA